MATAMTLKASERSTGKGAARRARREGLVPGVVYGHDQTPTPVAIERGDLERLVGHQHGLLVELDIAGKKHRAILRDLVREPRSGSLVHVDFQTVARGETVEAEVPLTAVGEDLLQKRGLTMSWLHDRVHVTAKPESLPDHLSVDVGAYEEETVLHASDIVLPKGVTLKSNLDEAVLAIQWPAVRSGETEDAGQS